MRSKHGGRLVVDRTAKKHISVVKVTESQFADDTATYTTSRKIFENSAIELLDTVKDWGMTVSVEKTKGMVVGINAVESDNVLLRMERDLTL